MGRPARHDAEALLDAGVRLFVDGGARAVTMAAVARQAGAPSGSVYHRFSDRAALLRALWQRAVEAFDDPYREQLGDDPTPQHAVEMAVWVVEWCRNNQAAATVLHAGKSAFSPEQWSAADTAATEAYEEGRDRAVAARVKQVAKTAGRRPDEVAFAMLEMPIAVVRRSLPEPVPADAADLVRRLASLMILGEAPPAPGQR
jgi:AcrR family transcriptional regulator